MFHQLSWPLALSPSHPLISSCLSQIVHLFDFFIVSVSLPLFFIYTGYYELNKSFWTSLQSSQYCFNLIFEAAQSFAQKSFVKLNITVQFPCFLSLFSLLIMENLSAIVLKPSCFIIPHL